MAELSHTPQSPYPMRSVECTHEDSATGEMSLRRGIFITVEGVDGAGKSTHVALLVERLQHAGYDVAVAREPGGTDISEQIRTVALDPKNSEMSAECELLLYEAARAQLVQQVIKPTVERGGCMVCDRFFDSTHAYQAGARGLDDTLVRQANMLGSCGMIPDVTLVLDMDPVCAYARVRTTELDRMEAEGLQFQQRVRRDYLACAQQEPERVHIIDATGSIQDVADRIDAELARVGVCVGEYLHE